MREVQVPTGFAPHRYRCPAALIAAWLLVLQAFLAGVATAQAGVLLAAGAIDAAAICHGAGGGPGDSGGPDAEKLRHLCCAACLPVPVSAPPPSGVSDPEPRRDARPPAFAPFIFVISPGAVRAGPSQAPPASV
jgi:hypothetical protein